MLQFNLRSFSLRITSLLLLVVAASSFSVHKGGDMVEVYLNDKRVIQHFVSMDAKAVKTFSLDRATATDKVRVLYSHCGNIGKSRSITITNEANKTLKTFRFSNDANQKMMECNATDLLALVKENNSARLNLVYRSEEIPDGKIVAGVFISKGARLEEK